MWQEILVILIGLFVSVYVIWKLIRFFTRKEASPCAGCAAGCPLKDTKEALTDACERKTKK